MDGAKCQPHRLGSETLRVVLIDSVGGQSYGLDARGGMEQIPTDELVQIISAA